MDINKIRNTYMNLYGDEQHRLFHYYENDPNFVPIFSRRPKTDLKSQYHTNVHIDFAGMIIDFKVGYMGHGIEAYLDNSRYPDDVYEHLNDLITDFEAINSMDALNSQSLKWSSIAGISHRLLYLRNGKIRAKNLKPWNVVYEYEDDIYDPDQAFVFYEVEGLDGKVEFRCDVYDRQNVTHYKKQVRQPVETKNTATGGNWILRTPNGKESATEPHLLGEVPVIPFYNNDEMKGDFYKALDTMDTYDEIISDESAEIKSIRGNYLVVAGEIYTGLDENGDAIPVRVYLKENNLIGLPIDPETGKPQGDVKVLDVNIPDTAIENTLRRLREHIFEECQSIDIKQITNADNTRVFTVRTSLMPVENNATTTEQYFQQALRKQYRIWAFYINQIGEGTVESVNIRFNFNRNFPEDILSDAQTLSILMNNMSAGDAYRYSGFENPDALADRYEQDRDRLLIEETIESRTNAD